MKNSISFIAYMIFLAVFLFLFFTVGNSHRLNPGNAVGLGVKGSSAGDKNHVITKEGAKEELSMELYPTGSSLPDCSHACGPCFPCRRVMVSFKCSIAESCPIVYRCMCKGRFYHIPSN
ncbi:protein EPIDERMAL PATTERNING FACTOR 2-like [Tasmannia lanceolata]|uniref:protein EPIDERMAL PATTERNING FACTOR 2-like n=1 Tax=Tasmannia lanceolata TaxID=3420 RepID=UPI0040644CF1